VREFRRGLWREAGNTLRPRWLAGSFGASAWKLAARDSFIGWDRAQRERNLPLVVNDARAS
jgi:hypothetical protein